MGCPVRRGTRVPRAAGGAAITCACAAGLSTACTRSTEPDRRPWRVSPAGPPVPIPSSAGERRRGRRAACEEAAHVGSHSPLPCPPRPGASSAPVRRGARPPSARGRAVGAAARVVAVALAALTAAAVLLASLAPLSDGSPWRRLQPPDPECGPRRRGRTHREPTEQRSAGRAIARSAPSTFGVDVQPAPEVGGPGDRGGTESPAFTLGKGTLGTCDRTPRKARPRQA